MAQALATATVSLSSWSTVVPSLLGMTRVSQDRYRRRESRMESSMLETMGRLVGPSTYQCPRSNLHSSEAVRWLAPRRLMCTEGAIRTDECISRYGVVDCQVSEAVGFWEAGS